MTRLTLWDPFHQQLSDLHNQLSRFVDDASGHFPSVTGLPPVNIWETDDEVIVELSVPGFKDEHIDIQVAKDGITIAGEFEEKDEERDKKRKTILRQEIRTSSFSRTIALPTDVNPEKAEASFEDGILTVTIAKAPETMKRKIKVTSKK